jgi:hypothetical protein
MRERIADGQDGPDLSGDAVGGVRSGGGVGKKCDLGTVLIGWIDQRRLERVRRFGQPASDTEQRAAALPRAFSECIRPSQPCFRAGHSPPIP